MTRWRSWWKYCVLVLLLPISGCVGCYSIHPHLLPAWVRLNSGEHERPGYGAYSYVLFGSRASDDADAKKYTATLDALLRFAPSERAVRPLVKPAAINLIHVPVDTAKLRGTPDHHVRRDDPGAMAHLFYDYGTASALLQNTGEPSISRGPYLVTTVRPLSTTAAKDNVIVFLDLTNVPVGDVPLWVEQFCNDLRSQEQWEDRGVRVFFLKVRAGLGTVAMVAPIVNEAADRFFKLIAKPK